MYVQYHVYTYANENQTFQEEEEYIWILEGDISIEFLATLTQSQTNFHKIERRESRKADG